MSNPWFFRPQPRPDAKTKLYVFHHAGGSASSYHKWHRATPEAVELILVELPARGRRMNEQPIANFDSLINDLRTQFFLEDGRPFALFGHSFGALIAYELANFLRPVALGISSILPPLESNQGRREYLSGVPDDVLIKKLAVYAPMPEEVLRDPGILKFYLDVIRHDLRLIDSYTFRRHPMLSVPTMVFGGRGDTGLKTGDLEGWSQLCTVQGPVHYYDGNHFFINTHFSDVQNRFLSMIERI